MTAINIRTPDDCHCHLRQDDIMQKVVPSSRHFGRVIVMPNTRPHITSYEQGEAYRDELIDAGAKFKPMMTLSLTDATTREAIYLISSHRSRWAGCKLYPAGATTNSDEGSDDISDLYPLFEVMQERGVPLLLHGECDEEGLDFFSRESRFIEKVLYDQILDRFEGLKVVLEHISTAHAAEAVLAHKRLWATVTPQHLLLNRNHLFRNNKLHPYAFCHPVLKTEADRQVILSAVTGRHQHKFFAGTDSAPHPTWGKEVAVCNAGCFTAPLAVAMYAQALEDHIDILEPFLSEYGARFYGWELNEGAITLDQVPPYEITYDRKDIVKLFDPGPLRWRVRE